MNRLSTTTATAANDNKPNESPKAFVRCSFGRPSVSQSVVRRLNHRRPQWFSRSVFSDCCCRRRLSLFVVVCRRSSSFVVVRRRSSSFVVVCRPSPSFVVLRRPSSSFVVLRRPSSSSLLCCGHSSLLLSLSLLCCGHSSSLLSLSLLSLTSPSPLVCCCVVDRWPDVRFLFVRSVGRSVADSRAVAIIRCRSLVVVHCHRRRSAFALAIPL